MPDKTPWGPEHPKYPECPVAPGTEVTLWFRGDLPRVTTAPHLHNWRHFDHPRDIFFFTDHSAPDQARDAALEEAAAVADDYRENAGGSESYKQACRHIAERLRSMKGAS